MASVVSGISNVVEGLFQSIFGLINHAWNLILSIFGTAWSAVEGIVNAVLHTISGLLATVTHVAGDLIGIVTGERPYEDIHALLSSHAHLPTLGDLRYAVNLVPIAVVGGGILLLSVFAGSKGSAGPVQKAKSAGGRKKKA